MNITPTTGNDD